MGESLYMVLGLFFTRNIILSHWLFKFFYFDDKL